MIWSIAWRNVWRNKVRSIIMIVAIALGLIAGVFTMAFMQGTVDARIESATKSELAHLQIHAPHFSENNESSFYISNATELVNNIENLDSVKAASSRLIAEPFITAAHGTGGGKLVGIDIEKEKNVTDIWEHLIDGTYLEKTSRMPPVLIGDKLAKKLKLKVGSKINVQMVDLEGDLSAKGYRVCGIFKTTNNTFDETNLFVRSKDLQTQLGIEENTAHEIAILVDKGDEAPLIKSSIQNIAGENVVETWKELSPEMSLLTDAMDQYMYIFILIILLGLCFGIINTMLMAVLERVKEIGMLMAVGMNKRKIFRMIILESVLLTLTGGFFGILFGSGITKFFETTPIDMSMFSEGLGEFGFATQVYTSLQTETLVTISILVVITGLLSAIYPARKALKLNPAEATRTD
ncbi:MAG: ABC transporter permease [Prolixibacteraceae bacterium]|jgi:putative ABC transport system permease protein|nr:ABC transporter permease [Prolixibacteraceae bacterium]MBT6765926.1 ABC transporter permease [Prolixibacteraceae bacterium]MBT6998585.1 ABC transporter permease [Prolixibacteraceae bacterium]MBT7395954.1 ABC transporter permease [Prolixibacteraceae bacterium]